MKSVVILTVVLGVCFFSWTVNAQAGGKDTAVEIQKLSSQSQKLMEEYVKNKQKIEEDLQQKLRVLTTSPGDRARRRQWMEESNQKLLVLKYKFSVDMEAIHSSQRDILDNSLNAQGLKGKKKGFSAQELKAKITRQEDQIRQEMEEASPLKVELPKEYNNPQSSLGGNQNIESVVVEKAKTQEFPSEDSKYPREYQKKSTK